MGIITDISSSQRDSIKAAYVIHKHYQGVAYVVGLKYGLTILTLDALEKLNIDVIASLAL